MATVREDLERARDLVESARQRANFILGTGYWPDESEQSIAAWAESLPAEFEEREAAAIERIKALADAWGVREKAEVTYAPQTAPYILPYSPYPQPSGPIRRIDPQPGVVPVPGTTSPGVLPYPSDWTSVTTPGPCDTNVAGG